MSYIHTYIHPSIHPSRNRKKKKKKKDKNKDTYIIRLEAERERERRCQLQCFLFLPKPPFLSAVRPLFLPCRKDRYLSLQSYLCTIRVHVRVRVLGGLGVGGAALAEVLD